MLRGGHKTSNALSYRTPVGRPKALPPEANVWWWHPNRIGVKTAPDSFKEKLWLMDDKLAVTWNAYRERWQVWMRRPKLQSPVCQGWVLLFINEDANHEYMPLDERVFARLYAASADKWGNGRDYFQAVEREIEREREKAENQYRQDTMDIAMESFDHSQIKVSMAGKSSGSKFSEFHS
jgi:hypothetical protein